MNSLTITILLCSSCALIVFYVNAQTICPSGWFGPRCQYKCYCSNKACDDTGKCTGSNKCIGGWFGPGCQYRDLAYLAADTAVLSDGDDSSCNTNARLSTTTVLMNETTPFTWMRVQFKGPGPVALDKLQLTFFEDSTPVTCDDPTFQAVTNWTVDMHCHLPREINKLILMGETVTSLCSIYVSGGRNVALKEAADQDSVYRNTINNMTVYFTANLSVDGNTNSSLYNLTCSHTYGTLVWRLKLSQPRLVHTYILYNRMDSSSGRSIGFSLDSFDKTNNSVFGYKDNSTEANATYRITHTPLSVQSVIITYNHSSKILQMCELEVYGDSECDNLHYGRDCELSCTCALRRPCYVTTGGCDGGCAVGFRGDACETGCVAGKFGQYCNETCSEKCESPVVANTTFCNISSGECLRGCESGFKGDFCQDVCDVGKFGKGCNSSCSGSCVPSDETKTTSCNPSSGACLKGCLIGFIGSLCLNECDAGKFGINCSSTCSQNCAPRNITGASPCNHTTGSCYEGCQSGFIGINCGERPVVTSDTSTLLEPIIVTACLLIAAIGFFGYCFCNRRTTRQSAEKKDASIAPELLH